MLVFPITECDVEALVDSQLGWEEEKRVRAALEVDPALRAYHRQIVDQKRLLVAWWLDQAARGRKQ